MSLTNGADTSGAAGTSGAADTSGASVSRRRLACWMALLGLAVAAWSAPGAWVRSSHGAHATGDEPQYLLTAQSLADDLDLDVSDERTAGVWRPYSEAGPPPHQEAVQPGGAMVSPHDPLLPALLAAPVRLAGWMAAKLALAAMAGVLAATMLWVAVRRLDVPLRVAAAVAGVFAASAPLAVYGTQVYPELPAALAVTLAVAALTGRPSIRTASGWALAVVALPWLSVKYAPVAAVIAFLGLTRLVRAGRVQWTTVVGATFAVAGVAYLAAHHAWYGGWTVYAAGDHFVGGELTVAGTDPDYAGRSARLLGLVTDRHFGLAVWQPAFLLAVPALAALVRRRPTGWTALVAPLGAGWLVATFVALTMHGWWWPGRQTVVVVPLAVLAVAWWLASASPRLRAAAAALGAVGVATFAVLAVEGLAGHLTWVVDFDGTANPLVRAWRSMFPDYRAAGSARWVLHGLWAVAAAGAAAWGWRSYRPAAPHVQAEARRAAEPEPLTKEVIPT